MSRRFLNKYQPVTVGTTLTSDTVSGGTMTFGTTVSGATVVGGTTVRGATVSGTTVVGSVTAASASVGVAELSATALQRTSVYSNPLVDGGVTLSAVPIFYAKTACTVKDITLTTATSGSYITGAVSGFMISVYKTGAKGYASAGVPVISRASSGNQTPLSGMVPWSLGTVNVTSGGLLAGEGLSLDLYVGAAPPTGFPYFTIATTWEAV